MAVSQTIKFFNFSNLPKIKKLDYSNRIKITYKRVVDKESGLLKLIVKDKSDIVDEIQSYADDVDIYKLIQKFENGDLNAFNRNAGFYGDVSNLPSSLIDVQKSLAKFEGAYNSLDKELLKKMGITNLKSFINSIYEGVLHNVIDEKKSSVQKNTKEDEKIGKIDTQTSITQSEDIKKTNNEKGETK